MEISKIFTFETAHKLSQAFEKKCCRIHGHSYKCEVFFTGSLNSQGVVVDFSKIKLLVGGVFQKLDHKLLLDKVDDFKLASSLMKAPGLLLCSFNPTAENLAVYVYQECLRLMGPDFKHLLSAVKIHETCTSSVLVKKAEIPKFKKLYIDVPHQGVFNVNRTNS